MTTDNQPTDIPPESPETPDTAETPPAEERPETSLKAILSALTSPDEATRLAGLEQLGDPEIEATADQEAALQALERLVAQDESRAVREAALAALAAPAYRQLQRRRSRLPQGVRQAILSEIERWQTDGLISDHIAGLLRQRYDFSRPTPQTAPAQPAADQPRPSLSEVLLSETSIKVALYLGAFFVISAACILASAIEMLRLPLLGLTTVGFLGAALALKQRLPQASFILFIVFSFILPIDAWVLLDTVGVSNAVTTLAWIGVSLALSGVWAFGTIFYSSRFFSLLALLAATAAAVQIGRRIDGPFHLDLFLVALPTLAGLGISHLLSRWRDPAFARPFLLLTQLQQIGLLGTSGLLITFALLDQTLTAGWWPLIALTWLLGTLFFGFSHSLTRWSLFPPLAVAALLPVPLLLARTFDPSLLLLAGITCGWGVGVALTAEATTRIDRTEVRPYTLPLFLGSTLLFIAAPLLAIWDEVAVAVGCWLVAMIVYGGLTWLRPRPWLWSGTLLAGTAAYFTTLLLPRFEPDPASLGFALLWPTLVLLTINLVVRRRFAAGSGWYLPPLILGGLCGVATLLVTLAIGLDEPWRATVAFVIIAVYATLFGLIDRQADVGYGATSSLALALGFVLFDRTPESWVLPLVGLAVVYFLAGLALNRIAGWQEWGTVLRWSGLGLGAIVALSSPLQGDTVAALGAALVATLFAVDAYLRRNVWLGFPATLFYLVAYFLLLWKLEVEEPQVYAIGAALLGFIMHYLLVRSGNSTAAFITGLISQLTLLGTTYIQMAATDRLLLFFVLFGQSLIVLTYGLVIRSRSLVIAPLFFVVLGVITVTFSVLSGVPTLILIGCTGLLLLILGILALLQRERLLSMSNRLSDQLDGWQA